VCGPHMLILYISTHSHMHVHTYTMVTLCICVWPQSLPIGLYSDTQWPTGDVHRYTRILMWETHQKTLEILCDAGTQCWVWRPKADEYPIPLGQQYHSCILRS
jgi:hypothetical protein